MSRVQVLQKLNRYKKNPDVYQALSPSELADLVVVVLSQMDSIENAIKQGRLDGYTPQADKDYMSKQTAQKMLSDSVKKMVSEYDVEMRKKGSALEEQVQAAIQRIRDGKDGIVSDEEIGRAAQIAANLIDLPDFDEEITKTITSNGGAIRDALELLSGDERYEVQIEDVNGLEERLQALRTTQGGNSMGTSKPAVYAFIRDAIADGIITTGSSPLTTKGDLYTYSTEDARLGVGSNGQVLQADSNEATGLKWATIAGTGDVTAASSFGTDNRLIRSDGIGKGVQASGITVSDTDAVSGATIDADNNTISNIALGAEATGAINDLSDVTITTPADNEVLAYDGVSDFINQTPAEAGLATSAQGALADSALQNIVEDTTPQLGGMLDVNGNAIGDGTRELLTFTEDLNAVNHVNIENQATGSGPTISAEGDDVNIDLNIFAKGNGQIKFGDNLNLNSVLVEGGVLPTTDNTYTLGSRTLAYSQIHLSDAGYIAWANETGFLFCDGTTGAIEIASNGTQAPTISSNGNTDLIIQTGNTTTGSITLTDGANGNINIAPNGTGEAQVSGQKIIDESDKTGADASVVSGTAGTSGNLAQWNVDGDLVDASTTTTKLRKNRFAVRLVESGTDVATGTTIGGDYRISDEAITVVGVGAYVDTAGTTGVSTIDINEGGTTILSTKITIDSTEKTSETAATAPVISDSAIAADGVITIDVDGVSTTAPQGLVVWVDYYIT